MQNLQRRPWLAWGSVSLLGFLCGGLALLQYRWIGEIADAERSRLREELQVRLNALSRAFNEEITAACNALLPTSEEIEASGNERAYAERYLRWKQSHEALFQQIGLAVPENDGMRLLLLNLDTAQFAPGVWPADWVAVGERLERRDGGPGPGLNRDPALLEVRRFGPPADGVEPWRREMLLLQLNLEYVRATVLPRFLHRYLGEGGTLDYDVDVVASADPSVHLYSSDANRPHALNRPDAWVGLLEPRTMGFGGRGRGGGRGPERASGTPRFERRGPPPVAEGVAPPVPEIGQGRWRLLVWHRAGSLDALVAATRRRNLIVSAGILALILATVAALVRFSRRAHRLAELQMNFVAGVSHELRTPLTVIRTAAFNLRGKVASRPEQVEKYGALIQSESEKLTLLVEQVLRFAGSHAGHVIRSREPVVIGRLIDDGLQSIATSHASSNVVIEKRLDPSLPTVLADELALRHVLQNLVDNALKYGTADGGNWIGVFVSTVEENGATAVEIRVADHGPGIPHDEQEHVFDPFFRGRRAVQDQIHGTGLGLNLVKKIVEAHGGTIRVESEPTMGTQFIVRIPAAPAEYQDEFANSSG